MTKEILETTKNIINSVNNNKTLLLSIFQKYITGVKNITSDVENISKQYLQVLLKLLIDIEFSIISKDSKKSETKEDTKKWLKRFETIKKKVTLSTNEKKYVEILINYFKCLYNILSNKSNYSVSSDVCGEKTSCAHVTTHIHEKSSSQEHFVGCNNTCHTIHESSSEECSKSNSSSKSISSSSSKGSCGKESSSSCSTSSCCNLVIDSSYNLCDLVKVCNDKKNIKTIQEKLCCVSDLFKLLKSIMCLLEKQYLDQLLVVNCKSPLDTVDFSDADYLNKMLTMYAGQFENVAENHCGEFFDCAIYDASGAVPSVPQTIEVSVQLCNNSTLVACIVDNICITIEEDQVIIFINNTEYIINKIDEGVTYEIASDVIKDNLDNIKLIKTAICANERIVEECINTLNYLIECGLLKKKKCCK